MPITATTPFEKDGKQYPHYLINLSISPNLMNESVGASVAMKLTPYKENEDGTIEQLNEECKSLVYLDVYQDILNGDKVLEEAVYKIAYAIQDLIKDKKI
jgi:hypothetical protein